MKTNVFVVSDGNTAKLTTSTTNAGYVSGTGALSFTTSNLPSSITTTNIPPINGTVSFGYVQAQPPTYNDFWKFDEEFDLLWKSFFDNQSVFKPVREKAVNHPCDIQETDLGLRIELAAVGLDHEEIEIITDSETLRVAYRKTEEDKKQEANEYRYLHRSIKKASFDIAWKISSKYDLQKLVANLNKGLLTLDIPYAKENRPKRVKINTAK